ncbi:MAG TPA: hypothetical protein DD624_07380 [Alphaproteobacteria bacterium]|mgnify:CR=1 FL=1|nr:hypothetical protein [Alphaproteobacteria bacterium]
MIIVNKQVSEIAFRTPNGVCRIKGNGVLNTVSDEDWEYILNNYGGFIRENTFSDKNPTGFFVWNEKAKEAEAAGRELAFTEGVDGCERLTATEAKKAVAGVDVKASVDGMKWADLKKYAASLGVKVPREWGRAQLTEAVKEAEKNA